MGRVEWRLVKRLVILLIALNVAMSAAVLGLWLESRHLRAELSLLTAPPAPEAPGPAEKIELHAAIRAEQDRNAILQSDLAGLRRRLEALEARSGPKPDPAKSPPSVAAAPPALEIGASLDPDHARRLGLSADRFDAVNRIVRSERERFTAAARAFFADHVDRSMPGLFDMTLAQLLRKFWSNEDLLSEDWRAWRAMSAADLARVQRGEATYEDVLGPHNRVWIMQRALFRTRLETHAELAKWLSAEQMALVRRELLPEGTFVADGATWAIGDAPPGLRTEVSPGK